MGANKGSTPGAHNKQVMLRFQEDVFNSHDWRVETLAKYLTPDFVDHTAGPDAVQGLEGVAQRYTAWHSAFGDAHKENIAVLSEGDLVSTLYEIHTRHSGEFMGVPPTGKSVIIPGIEIMRLRDGKISEYWSIYDYLNTAAEIGARIGLVPRATLEQGGPVEGQDVYRGIVHGARKKHNVFVHETTNQEVAQNKATLLRFQQEVFNGHDWRVETLAKHLHPDFVDHAAGPWDKPGLEGVSERFSIWQSAFSEAMEENMAMVGDGDMLTVLYDLHAEHRGPFLDIPATNRHVTIPGIELLRFRDGKIAEHWGVYDFQSTARQLDAVLVFTPGMVPELPIEAEEAEETDQTVTSTPL